jgi:hypothetical protein
METLLIYTRYKESTEDSTSKVNQRQNLVGLTVFLKHPATADHYMAVGARAEHSSILTFPLAVKSLQLRFLLKGGEKL